MSASLRVILFIASILTCAYITRKLRKSQVQIMDTIFWFGLSTVFILFATFPQFVTWISKLMGFAAAANFVFLVTIFLLLIRCFLLSIRVSQLDERLKNLTEELAIREAEKQFTDQRGTSR